MNIQKIGSVEPVITRSETYPTNGETHIVKTNGVTDKSGMTLEQLNEYIVKRAAVIRGKMRNERMKFWPGGMPHTTDIIPPYCHSNVSLHKNIENLMASYNNTVLAALFCEHQSIKTFNEFRALSNVVDGERSLIFEFLSENDLLGKFNEFVILKKAAKVS